MASSYRGVDAIVSATRAAAVTLHDTNTIENTRALYIGGAGNLKVTMNHGDAVTFNGLQAGTILPIQVTVCWTTGSTASNIVALY